MRCVSRGWVACIVILACGLARGADEPAKPAEPSREALEKKFAEEMSGVVFAGAYSVTRDGKETPSQMEKYTITKVVKLKGDLWQFNARMQYGKTDLTIPMVLPVKWADDTPVISLTDLTIPAVGTFTARVMIYGDRYAGTWQHGKIGGHMWGRLEKLKPETGEEEKPKASEEKPAGK